MKIISLPCAALAGAIGVAYAGVADAQPTTTPAAAPPSVYDWSGFYVGLNGGLNSTNTSVRSATATVNQLSGVSAGAGPVAVGPASFATAPVAYASKGAAGGGQIGWNKQFGHLVLGVEGDIDSTGLGNGRFSDYLLPGTALTTGSTVQAARFTAPEWTSTVRLRGGVAFGRALFYVTGGAAAADLRQTDVYSYIPTVTTAVAAANPGAALGPSVTQTTVQGVRPGWVAGGGAEFALDHGVSIGAEYRHSDYGDPQYVLGAAGAGEVSEAPHIHFDDDQVLARINYRFNGLPF